MRKLQINIGDKYNRLTVVETGLYKGQRRAVRCICSCGKETVVTCSRLINGKTKSCGCLRGDIMKSLFTIHGLAHTTPLSHVWASMRQRCNNPNNTSYKNYGARGIKVCSEWDDFAVFYSWAIRNGYQKDLTLERINNDGDYNPANCCFVSRKLQANNRRGRVSKYSNGKRINLRSLARQYNLIPATLYSRLSSGLSLEEALTREVRNLCE